MNTIGKVMVLAALAAPLVSHAALPRDITTSAGSRLFGGEDARNFALRAKVRVAPGGEARLKFHTDAGLRGYEVLFRNGSIDGSRKTGSLSHVRNLYRSLAADGAWFDFALTVRERNVEVKVSGVTVVSYTEPANPYRTAANAAQRLSRGDFAFLGDRGEVAFRDVTLEKLADGVTNPADTMPPVDEQTDRAIRKQQVDFPVIDYHVHLKGGLTKEIAQAKSLNYGINYGVAPNVGEGGYGRMLRHDAEAAEYLAEVTPLPFLRGAQGEGRRWPYEFSKAQLEAFDYTFTDAMTVVDGGVPLRIYREAEFRLNGRSHDQWMDFLVGQIEKILDHEPVDIYANATYLPDAMARDYDAYWTQPRIDRLLAALARNGVALEISANYRTPSATIIRQAKARGIKFTFGSNNGNANFGRLEYPLDMVDACGLTAADMWFPSMSVKAKRAFKPYNAFKASKPVPRTAAACRALAAERVAAIRATPNRTVPAGAPRRYLSAQTGDDAADGLTPATAWRTPARLNREKLAAGTWVLFARGGVYRGSVRTCPGCTYTACGEGPKPRIYGSPENGADPAKWSRTDNPNVWAYQIGHNDVGTLVFDDGASHARKIVIRTDRKTGKKYNKFTGRPFNSYRDLDGDLHFWHDYYKTGTGRVYLYSAENPGTRFKSIEFNVKCCGIGNAGNADVTIDNLCVMYVGVHGIGSGTCKGLHVGNCEFGWIGGSIQGEAIFGRDHPTRLGNAVEIYGGCDDYSVTNCYIWQVYDAGVTHQVGTSGRVDHKNVLYKANVFEKCNYSVEYFLSFRGTAEEAAKNPNTMENVVIEDNLMFDAGYGFCEQRPDGDQGAHIKSWGVGLNNRARYYVIRNNAMIGGKDMLVQIGSGLKNLEGGSSLPVFAGNVLSGRRGQQFGVISQKSNTRLKYDEKIPAFIDTFGKGNECLFE